MKEEELKKAFQELMKLMKASIAAFGQFIKSKSTGTTQGEELAKLEAIAKTARANFDQKLAAVIGDLNTNDGRNRNSAWGFYVQKSAVLGLVGSNAFRYVDPRYAESMRLTAESYIAGHKALKWTVEYGVNPRSVQTLAGALEKALRKAEGDSDPDRVQQFRAALSGLKRHASRLLTKKAETPNQGQFTMAQGLQSAETLNPAPTMKEAVTPNTPSAETRKGQRPARKPRG